MFLEYLHTGVYTPRPSVPTIANAMDVGDPSNFARILDLYGKNGNPHAEISQLISGYRFTDEEIGATMKQVYNETGYVLDPHGACGYQALIDNKLAPNETGLFLETAHPAKFKDGRQNTGCRHRNPRQTKSLHARRKAKRRDGKGLRDFQKLSVGTINILHQK